MTQSERPVIGFLTDFGTDGAAATCHGVMLGICRDAQIVDISHSVRKFAVAHGAFILRAALPYLPVGVHVGVVDPGVGTARRPIGVLVRRGDILIGPDNGLLMPAADALSGVVEVRELANEELRLLRTSSTFHGRDIFAPVAAHLAAGNAPFAEVGPVVADPTPLALPEAQPSDGELRTSVVYVDTFGNLRLAGGRSELTAALGELADGTELRVSVADIDLMAAFAPSFGHVGAGETLLYVDSTGDLAMADNQGDLAARIGAREGAAVVIGRA